MSEFWKRKMRTYFHTFDFSKAGYVREEDFAEMGRGFAEAYNANDEKKDDIIQIFVNLWRMFMKAGGVENDGRLTLPILTESIKQQMYGPGLVIEFDRLFRGLHGLMDVDEDGYLQPDDHRNFFRKSGFPEGAFDEKFAFEAMDTDGDGKISIDEFLAACLDFLFSQDETSPNKFFFGPLVD